MFLETRVNNVRINFEIKKERYLNIILGRIFPQLINSNKEKQKTRRML
ncbi:MAG: hypothetical protein WJU30_00283 [Candidatus Phytoplasma pruni]